MRLCEVLLIAITGGAVFVNGFTDAPNAIAGAVATGAMSYRAAVRLAAVCNLAGLLVIGFFNGSVADTIISLADFGAASPSESLAALLAAMAAIICFAVAAWFFGIPTSESHALIAALAGSALALAGGRSSFNAAAWKKVLAGLLISLVLGYLSGIFLKRAAGGTLRKLSGAWLDRFQALAAGGMAFMHGAQDGQKFAAVFVIAEMLAKGGYGAGSVDLKNHALVTLFCAVLMALGTSAGGRRIVETVGTKMVTLEKPESVSADLGGGLCLLIASLSGIPMSTTHVKTTAIMGAAGGKNPAVIGGMILAWILTFPVCGALGYAFTQLAVKYI